MKPFEGTARYEVVRQLGSGGMGAVYEVADRERGGQHVALKVLHQQDPESLVRLKREFRALADVRHRNLAAPYDLVGDEAWFFTLELVDGVDFLSWVRPGQPAIRDVPTAALDQTVRAASPTSGVALARLREGLGQLVEAIAFLHGHGRLHRDLKPSNVLVTKEGRVVVLDFGLVAPLGGPESVSEQRGDTLVGTCSYMAPEQASPGAPVGPPADWYAVGVMLFQALTGRLPFEGAALQVLVDKQTRPPPTVRSLDAAAPAELDELCARLLCVDPAQRPDAGELLRFFGGAPPTPAPARAQRSAFLGRERERGVLREALEASRREPRLVRLAGASGIGKSALVARFVEDVEGVVLQGRCYERESVPFKALDSVIDALARHLAGLPGERADAVLPRDAAALRRMFPGLGRVRAFAAAPTREVKEPQELRRRAVQGLRELLARMGDRSPLVIVIDDAQWGDGDSAQVLNDVLRLPDAPALLLLLVSRTGATPLDAVTLPPVLLTLEGLGPADCERLARHSLEDPARATAVARESGGNPFLLQQLAAMQGDVRLEDVVRARVETLPVPARRLLEVVAVAATPIPERVAATLARLDPGDLDTVRLLKVSRLVRGLHDERIECWHDRIREAVLGALDQGVRATLHARLADALEPLGDVDVIAWHLGAAGLVERAADATLRAAEQAARQLAFERAVVLFARALEFMAADDVRRRQVRIALAEALASAGRGAQSAREYERSLQDAGEGAVAPQQSLELRRLAAEQLLRSGHIDEGLSMVNQVLDALGMHLAKTPARALLALAARRVHLGLRGLSFVETPASRCDPRVLQRIDACWSVSMGLSMVDTIRGASFQSRQLLLALDAGEPYRVARALAAEAAFVATGGVRSERRAARLVAEARGLAERVGDAGLIGLVDFCDGLSRFLVGRWREAAQLTAQAERRFAEVGSMVSWEAANSRLFAVWSLFYLGDLAGLSVRIPELTREAEQRGDRYAGAGLRCGLANVAQLAADDPAGARAAVRGVMADWSQRSFHFQHYWAALSETLVDLYTGETGGSLARLQACWRSLERSQLVQIQNVRIEARSLLARVLVTLGRGEEALGHARALERENVGWAGAQATLLRALVSAEPEEGLRAALTQFDQLEMALFSSATRLRLGEVQGGVVGEANVRAAKAWLAAQGVKRPERMAQLLVPRPLSARGA